MIILCYNFSGMINTVPHIFILEDIYYKPQCHEEFPTTKLCTDKHQYINHNVSNSYNLLHP